MSLFFSTPPLLLLLAVPVLLAWWEWTRAGHTIRVPFDHAGMKHNRWLSAPVMLANLLPYLLLATAIIILAGPRRYAPPKNERVMTNIQICLDISGSMGASISGGFSLNASGPTRFTAAMKAISEFTQNREGDAFGLTVFGNDYLHWMPLTKETSAIVSATPFVAPGKLPQWFNGTSIGNALLGCNKVLQQRPKGDRMIILVSDGQSSDLRGGQASYIANSLAEANTTVYMISIGGSEQAELYTIAAQTGGAVFSANDTEGLKTIFNRIDKMQKINIKQVAPTAVDCFEPFVATGIVLLLLQALALLGLRYTPW